LHNRGEPCTIDRMGSEYGRRAKSGSEVGRVGAPALGTPGKTTLVQQMQVEHMVAPAPVVARKEKEPAGNAGAPQAEHAAGAAEPTQGPSDAASAVRIARTGQRIDLPHRAAVEAKVGHDLSTLQVFTGPPAAQACAMIGAEAFTFGNTLVFASSSPPLPTVLHEITHALQQGGHRMVGDAPVADDVKLSSSGDAVEHEAAAAETGHDQPAADGGAVGQRIAADSLPAEAMVARKPKATDFCKVSKATPLLDKPGGKKLADLPVGTFVRVDSDIGGLAYNVTVVDEGSPAKGTSGVVPGGTIVELQGVINGKLVFNKGQLGGSLDASAINCLGNASGSNAATSVGQNALRDMLQGLGFTTIVGDHTALKDAMKKKREVMMVYLYMFRSDWRATDDQPLSFADLAKKYVWSAGSWEDKFVFVSAAGVRQPIDYHAIRYHYDTKKWGYVAHFKPKEADATYKEDTTPGEAAESDPDAYFGASQKLVSIACYR
jgi:hypothetical protein